MLLTGIAFAALHLATAQSAAPPELTIYNGGFALVKEHRQLNLQSGQQEIRIEDVPQGIETGSVGIRSLTAPGSFSVLEQNYQYDLISPIAILNKAVGQRVIFSRILPNSVRERLTGTLLSAPTEIYRNQDSGGGNHYSGMVLRTDDGRIILDPAGEIEVNSLPEGLISKPTLMWLLDSDKAGLNNIELSYLTNGMSWTADYVVVWDEKVNKGDLKGWVTINNNSGANYKGAKLKLLAGDVQRMGRTGRGIGAAMAPEATKAAAADSFTQEQFSEYHLYTLGRPATVRNNENKQLSLLEAVNIPISKQLVVDSARYFGYGYYGYRPGEGTVGQGDLKAQVRVRFVNNKASNLGMPLPAGNVKVFERDSTGSLQLLGEDHIDHTPQNEKLSLVLGHAFDIVANRKRTNFAWLYPGNIHGATETYQIELRNRKDSPEDVTVIERAWGQYDIVNNNMPFVKEDSDTFSFLVHLGANEVKKVVYTINTHW